MSCPITDFSKMLLKILVHEKVPKTMRRQKLSETICHIWKMDLTGVLLKHTLDRWIECLFFFFFTLYYTILHYTTLYCTIYYNILYHAMLYYAILYYAILYYAMLYYTILYYSFWAFAWRMAFKQGDIERSNKFCW